MQKRLYRSRTDRMLAGVCGGLAEYFNADPTLIRILAVIFLVAFNVAAVVGYLIMAVIVPLGTKVDIKPL
jgi:phage shock protein C